MTNQSPAEGLRLIKELLKGAIFATYDIVNLDADPFGNTITPGLSLDEAFEQQWKFIEPKLTAYAATVEREAASRELKQLVADTLIPENVGGHFIHDEVKEFAKQQREFIEHRLAALQGAQNG